MTAQNNRRLPALICPDCHSALIKMENQALVCESCLFKYHFENGIAQLIGSKSSINFSELEVQDSVSDLYENVRYTVDTSNRYHQDSLEDIISFAQPNGDVLEIGCGNGVFLKTLSSRKNVSTLSAVDLSNEMLKHTESRMLSVDSPIPWQIVRGDGERLPFEEASFDCIFARGLLHHLPEPKKGAKEIARVLRPGGVAFVVDPNRNMVSAIPRLVIRRTASNFDTDHKNFSRREMKNIVSENLQIESIKYWGYIAYPLLGFPDVLRFRWLPLGSIYRILMALDRALSKIPIINRLGWGFIVKVSKPLNNSNADYEQRN